MIETVAEFKEEIRTIRNEMRDVGGKADTKIVASWLDRLVIALEKLTPTLDLMSEGLDQVAENEPCACECCGMEEEKPMKKKAPAKKTKKKR